MALLISAMFAAAPVAACSKETDDGALIRDPAQETEISDENAAETNEPTENEGAERPGAEEEPVVPAGANKPPAPVEKTVKYIRADGAVNIRSGAGTNYAVRGKTEEATLYAYGGKSGGWYETSYKHGKAYVSAGYFTVVELEKSDNPLIEEVVSRGVECLGIEYVYGAARLHDGKGHLSSAFKKTAFDCSSLMQYIFYYGAHVNLDVNTRTQVYQGKTVGRADLKRGDLMFFTNASRYNNKGVERVGHVALYLGDGYILHTASDYAKIEKISSKRWSYFIQAQRIL